MNTKKLEFTAIILNSLTDKLTIKGCRTYARGGVRGGIVYVYFDEKEILDIITTLQYIKNNIDLEQKPDHDIWVYYKTTDDFEVGAKADKGRKFRLYFKKNYRFLSDDEVTMSRKDLDDVYDSFVYVRDFLKSH